jgi:glycerol-3-phosphate acyltransferase PlsY
MREYDMHRYVIVVLSYFVGTVPFGLIFTRIFKLGDVRKIGSGNTGATNVLRTGSYSAAFLTFAGDFTKGFVPVWLCCSTHDAPLIAISAVLGHVFSPWLNFRGGKGVATAAGAICAMDSIAFAIALLTWGSVFFLTRISSLAALVSICVVLPTYGIAQALYTQTFSSTLLCAIPVAVLVAFTHRSNIKRIINKDEPSFRS